MERRMASYSRWFACSPATRSIPAPPPQFHILCHRDSPTSAGSNVQTFQHCIKLINCGNVLFSEELSTILFFLTFFARKSTPYRFTFSGFEINKQVLSFSPTKARGANTVYERACGNCFLIFNNFLSVDQCLVEVRDVCVVVSRSAYRPC